jgi:hypothetical protein
MIILFAQKRGKIRAARSNRNEPLRVKLRLDLGYTLRRGEYRGAIRSQYPASVWRLGRSVQVNEAAN